MPGIIGSFKDCPVIIYGNDNDYIAEAIIKKHDRMLSVIEVSEPLEKLEQGSRLNVLIIHSSGAAEYSGTLRKASGYEREIALFNERSREARGAPRHKLNSPATIKSLVYKSGRKQLDPPIDIKIDNISRTGVLLTSPPGHFELGAVLEVHLAIQGKDAIIFASVVRVFVDDNDDQAVHYGCKFIFPNE